MSPFLGYDAKEEIFDIIIDDLEPRAYGEHHIMQGLRRIKEILAEHKLVPIGRGEMSKQKTENYYRCNEDTYRWSFWKRLLCSHSKREFRSYVAVCPVCKSRRVTLLQKGPKEGKKS
jgi:hypothetical protein